MRGSGEARFDPIIAFVHLLLASSSPRRAELLRAAGFTFDTVAAEVNEAVRAGESPSKYVRRLAAAKTAAAIAVAVAQPVQGRDREADSLTLRPDTIVLGADTAVIVDGEILGKPRTDEEGAAMLRRLSGRRHKVMTGISLRRGTAELGRVESTIVAMSTVSDADVVWYVASGEGRDKAGAYAIQGLASRFVSRIDGSYSNVVGLPIATVVELLAEIQR